MTINNPPDSSSSRDRSTACEGPPVGAEFPGWTRLTPPESYRDHPLVSDKLFYVLPEGLLDRVLQEIATASFDPELVDLERAMTGAARPPMIGFWGNRPLQSSWLAPSSLLAAMDLRGVERLGWSVTQHSLEALLAQADAKLDAMRLPVTGYLGWLLTNRTFTREHDQLLLRHAKFIRRNGLPLMGAVRRSVSSDSLQELGCEEADGQTALIVDEFEAFYVRWRLQGLNGPYAPDPLTPQLPVLHVPALLGHLKEGGQTFYLPDIYPVPGRDELRQLIEDNLRHPSELPSHLSDWQTLVSANRSERNQIQRFARLFALQHAIRLLYARHREALRNAKGHLQAALGGHFGVSADAIKGDLALIAERLGSGWEETPRAL